MKRKIIDNFQKKIGIIAQKKDESEKKDKIIEALLRKRARIINKATMRIPITIKIADLNRGKRIIIFHEDIVSANKIYKILKEKKHSVTIYHTKISHVIRLSNLLLFRRGIFDIIIACRALDEGLNVPDTEIAIISSSTATSRQRIQRLGRVLRPTKKKEIARIYTLFATESEKERLRSEYCEINDIASVKWMRANANFK